MTHPRAVPPSGDDEEVHYFFIKRPVLAIVISLIITILGVFAIRLLPVFHDLTAPAVRTLHCDNRHTSSSFR